LNSQTDIGDILSERLYHYKSQVNLSRIELFFWIAVDKTLQQLGVTDVGAVAAILLGQPMIGTRGKPIGATRGTSIASLACRQALNYELKFRLPMITGSSITTLRIALTKNLGAFVGRSVPVVGWVILAYDVSRIMWNTVSTYNFYVEQDDRIAA
jgi:hypothetical protein